MKQTIILALCFLTEFANGQTTKTPIPEMLNEINYHQASDNSLKPLEKTRAKLVTKIKGLGYGGTAMDFIVEGEKSGVRLTATDHMSFVVALGDGAGDPSSWFTFYKATIKKGKRSGSYSEYNMMGQSKTDKQLLPYSVKKIGQQAFEIIPDVKLEPGEYLFVNKGTLAKYNGTGADVFAFAVE